MASPKLANREVSRRGRRSKVWPSGNPSTESVISRKAIQSTGSPTNV